MLAQASGGSPGSSLDALIMVISVAGFVLWLIVIVKFFQLVNDVREIKVALRHETSTPGAPPGRL